MDHFISELRRRNVVRVAVAYLAFAWLVIQLVGEIGPILNMPEWFPQLVLLLLTVGFVATVVLAWVFELTHQGIRTTAEVDRDASLTRIDRRALDFAIIGLLVVALAYFIWESRFSLPIESSAEVGSIAVMPFRDLSADGDQAYFAEGMGEELLNALSRIPGLKVAGRTSSFALAASGADPQRVAEVLGVTHVLEGSVRTSGQRLRVTAQLLNTEDGFQVWSRAFEGDLSDVFAVQDEISSLVAKRLTLHLGRAESTAIQGTATTDMATYNEYLLGRYYLARRTDDGLRSAMRHFRAAIEADPEFAPAHAALARTLVVSPYYLPVASPADLAHEVKRIAQRAIDLDASNSEAWSALGTAYFIFDRDWSRAAEALKRSVTLHPNDAGNVNLYGDYLYAIGDYKGALVYETRAAELEPLSAAYQHEVALTYFFLGRVEEAIEQERLALNINSEFSNAWSSLGRFFFALGRHDDLRELLAANSELLGEHYALLLHGRLRQAEGNSEAAREAARRLVEMSRQRGLPMTRVAYLYAELGEDETAAALVEAAYASRDPILVSPLYFFIPEDWPGMPLLRRALDKPDLAELYDLRRRHMAQGTGRVAPRTAPSAGRPGVVAARPQRAH